MLAFGDLLKLHVQYEAEKFLKPWWDVFIDYFILVLVMIAVVTGVVGLYASGPVCIPVLRCPAQNSSSDKIATCAMIRNSSQSGGNSLDFAVQFTNRNMFDYINSECTDDIFWTVRFFPHMLVIMVGYCLVYSNSWFILKSPILEQFSDMLHQCYKQAYTLNTEPTAEQCILEIRNTCAASQDHTTSVRYITPKRDARSLDCAPVQDRNPMKTKLEKYVKEFDKNENCINFLGVNNMYIIMSVFQTVITVVIFGVLVWLIFDKKMNRLYECNIAEIKIPDLVYDHFVCSNSIVMFYFSSAVAFLVVISCKMICSFFKLASAISCPIWPLKPNFERVYNLNIESRDLLLLLKLLALSNPIYLRLFCEIYQEK
jgi:hypothetical protein